MTSPHDRSVAAPEVPAGFSPLAWNGLRLRVPPDWEPARLGRDYLGLESPDGPVMEVRFTRRPERLAPEEVVRRMLKKSPGEVTVGPEIVPGDWLAALSGRDSVGFDCGGVPVSRGVASLCRECGAVVVVRFFPAGEGAGGAVAREVLASVRDHGRREVDFELYGIRLKTPAGMELARFSFKPGRFDLEFSAPGRSLGFSRFAPAGVLLSGGDVAAFAGRYLDLPGLRLAFAPHVWRGRAAALAATPAPAGPLGWAADGLGRLLRRRRQARAMVWHEAAADKLAAAVWCGVRPPDVRDFDRVCSEYGIF
jgi:hypothetical protein